MLKINSRILIPSLLALLVIGFTGCGSKIDIEHEKDLLLKTDIEFSQASVAEGASKAFYMYMADDAIALPAKSKPIFGKEAICEQMSAGPEAILTWKPIKAEVSKAGDLGYTWGSFEVTWQGSDGTPKKSYGKYLNVWGKQSDGTWKVVVDIGNQSPPPEEDLKQ